MNDKADDLRMDLACPKCGWAEEAEARQIERRLRDAGLLKRNPHPSRDELRELLLGVAVRLNCPECNHAGLTVHKSPEPEGDWQAAPCCQQCGQPIDPERLEVFPDTRTCVACQRCSDRGAPSDQPEYCPRCGSLMEVRQTRGAGITRYALVCSSRCCSR
jgi:DNA-directed RNA polymerase subunit M/transcription elongation factor TFIIS